MRIDVHHHPTPPAALAHRASNDPGATARFGWTVQKALDDMAAGGVATAILSHPHSVGAFAGDAQHGRSVARGWNEYMATLVRDHPGRFGLFAALPVLDIEGSLREIEYAFDTLKADGIYLMTNIGERWLGDPHYGPIFEEMNRRKGVIYTHPIAPACCAGTFPELNDATLEFGFDTTRAIAKLIFSGSTSRFPDIRFIFSHAGGTAPFIAERFDHAVRYSKADLRSLVPKGALHELQRLYYDTAQAAHRHAMASLRELVSARQIVFGTDYPYRGAKETWDGLCRCGFSAAELEDIGSGNARQLFPQRGG